MGSKELNTLPQDIFELFNPNKNHDVNEEYLNTFCDNLKDVIRKRLASQNDTVDRPIRFSGLGKPNRQVWYDAHPDGSAEELNGKTYMKFMYGEVIEQLVLYLTKEAGHSVSDTQKEIEIDGITGSIDAIIDGVVVDVKSASPYGYKKFETNSVTEDDPFGYVAQLAGYANVLTPGEEAAWVAFDKVSGDICVSRLSSGVIKAHDPGERITELKEIINAEEPPARCYEPVPDGKSGNFALPTPCSYCKHKARCHPNLRVFLTGSGPKFLTTVVRPPTRKDGSLAHEITKV